MSLSILYYPSLWEKLQSQIVDVLFCLQREMCVCRERILDEVKIKG